MSTDAITPSLIEDITEVRNGGEVNMMDRKGVQTVANDMEFFDLVVWIEDNKQDYMKLLKAI